MPKKNALAAYLGRLGRKGGKARSAAKTAAARENGKLGGRPPQSSAIRLRRIRNRIAKGKPITAVEAALHYGDEMGVKKALAWALVRWTDAPPHTIERKWWDDVVASLERAR